MGNELLGPLRDGASIVQLEQGWNIPDATCQWHRLHLPFYACHQVADYGLARPGHAQLVPICGEHAIELRQRENQNAYGDGLKLDRPLIDDVSSDALAMAFQTVLNNVGAENTDVDQVDSSVADVLPADLGNDSAGTDFGGGESGGGGAGGDF